MGAFDSLAGLGLNLTRRPLAPLGEEDKSTPAALTNYGKVPPETTARNKDWDPNSRYRAKPDPKIGGNDQTTASPTASQLRTSKPAQSGAK